MPRDPCAGPAVAGWQRGARHSWDAGTVLFVPRDPWLGQLLRVGSGRTPLPSARIRDPRGRLRPSGCTGHPDGCLADPRERPVLPRTRLPHHPVGCLPAPGGFLCRPGEFRCEPGSPCHPGGCRDLHTVGDSVTDLWITGGAAAISTSVTGGGKHVSVSCCNPKSGRFPSSVSDLDTGAPGILDDLTIRRPDASVGRACRDPRR